ncbi:hypothetical protein M076_1027 [Bacteroides fragilis str. 2-F-2 |uniref:Uncharacterized protein n=1 Tax=Bacteroides fragilis str. 2-F-2 \|nr:hypothetical protein M077_1086 [Bacteroides fragilis str. 2-F-2 \
MTKDENLLKTGIFKKHALFSAIYKLNFMIIGYRKSIRTGFEYCPIR